MKQIKIVSALVMALAVTSCVSAKKTQPVQPTVYNINLECNATPDAHYNNLTHGLDIYVTSNIENRAVIDASESNASVRDKISNSKVNIDPQIKTFVNEATSLYARSLGINVGGNLGSDYSLRLDVLNFKVVLGNGTSNRGIVELAYTLSNPDNEILMRQTVRGRYVAQDNRTSLSAMLNKAFAKALQDINWDGIAGYLKTPKRADQQPTTQVKGDGNTALESTIIRWNVESRPAGADVYWRVVSSTPDVKNTNSTYLGTTPYESTESFDIRGLSFENSGNVQIEVKCERSGYIPQTRRFNLRQVIDQKEISTKFNLVKDEE